jgi:hypothetical protein
LVGLQRQWSMHAHVVNRWNTVTRVLIWGTMTLVNGFRTSAVTHYLHHLPVTKMGEPFDVSYGMYT